MSLLIIWLCGCASAFIYIDPMTVISESDVGVFIERILSSILVGTLLFGISAIPLPFLLIQLIRGKIKIKIKRKYNQNRKVLCFWNGI